MASSSHDQPPPPVTAAQIAKHQRRVRKKLLKAHRKGERGLSNLAEHIGKSERQTSRYLNEHGLSAAADPVGTALSDVKPFDNDTAARLLDDLQAMGTSDLDSSYQSRHTTCEHLLGNIQATFGTLFLQARLDRPIPVFDTAIDTADGFLPADDIGHNGLGVSLVGTVWDAEEGDADLQRYISTPPDAPVPQSLSDTVDAKLGGGLGLLDLLVVSERSDGVNYYPDAAVELTAYRFTIPENPHLLSIQRPDDSRASSTGLVLAPSLRDAAAAVLGVWPDSDPGGTWDVAAWRFAEQANQMTGDVKSSGRYTDVQEAWDANDKCIFWSLEGASEDAGEDLELVYRSMTTGLIGVRKCVKPIKDEFRKSC